jgi:hypothetical protein
VKVVAALAVGVVIASHAPDPATASAAVASPMISLYLNASPL